MALESIAGIDYQPIEVWIADDHSLDDSKSILKKWQAKRPDWNFVYQDQNLGNCKTFNGLLAKCRGEFVIDFATDDLLIAENINNWINHFQLYPDAAFCYADAIVFDQKRKTEHLFSKRLKRRNMPEGNILNQLLEQPFICPPAVLFRKSALEKVGGYDPQLAFEDLDIWLRLAKEFNVVYFNQAIVKYRKHSNSLSASLLRSRNQKILTSTILIIKRISNWETFKKGNLAYFSFIKYHLKIAGALQFKEEANFFYTILINSNKGVFEDRFWNWISKIRIPLYKFVTYYYKHFQ